MSIKEQNKQISIKNIFNIQTKFDSTSQMQRRISSGMLDSTNSNSCTPEQKLTKISFHNTQFDQFMNVPTNVESQTVEGWGNDTWNLRNSDFRMGRTQNTFNWISSNSKNTQSIKKYPPIRNQTLERTKYIEKLEEKLFELVSIKKERQYTNYINEGLDFNSSTPNKQTQNIQKTSSTSESQGQKYQHNFTSTTLRKQFKKNPLIKLKAISKQSTSKTPIIKSGKTTNELKLNLKTHLNRSILTSYQQMSQRSKEISMISYPVLDQERKPKHRRLTKLQDFKETFYIKQNPQQSFEVQNTEKKKTSVFRVKITQSKLKDYATLKINV